MTTRIILCRHGNTFDEGDIITRVGARTDLPLSSSGKKQAQNLQQHFHPASSPYKFTQAFCSNLRRTRETAQTILEGGHPAILEEKVFLTEIDYGIDENRPETDVVSRVGRQAISDWDTHATVPDGWQVNPEKIRTDWSSFLNEMSKTSGDVLVVTSNGIARFCLDVVDKIACHSPPLKLSTAAYGIVSCESAVFTMEGWNLKI